jgi:hypothetical protein
MRGSWSLRLRGEDNTNSLIEEEARSSDEGSLSLRLRGEDSTNSLIEEKVGSRDERFLESTPSGRGQKEFIH